MGRPVVATTSDPHGDASRGPHREPLRWPQWAAIGVAVSVVPANTWRLALAIGLPVGYDDQKLRNDFDLPGTVGALSLVALVVVIQGLALLAFGLVRPWGEVVPRWIPRLSGRCIPAGLVVAVAGAGSVILALLWIPFAVLWWSSDSGLEGTAHVVAGLCYVPMVVWGPLLGALTIEYRKRTRAGVRPTPASQQGALED